MQEQEQKESEELRQLERAELQRLLGTAKDAERRELIRASLMALDAAETAVSSSSSTTSFVTSSSAASAAAAAMVASTVGGLNPAIASRILGGGKVPLDTFSGSGRNRPTSAQRRRPSFTPAFEVVPENRTMLHRSVDRSREMELSREDIEFVFASCCDPKRPPLSIIPRCAARGIPEVSGAWVSTGGSPQVMMIMLSQRWLVRRLSFRCDGVARVSLFIDNAGRFAPSSRLGDATFTVFDLTDVPSEDPGGVVGKTLTLHFVSEPASDFFVVTELNIRAVSISKEDEGKK